MTQQQTLTVQTEQQPVLQGNITNLMAQANTMLVTNSQEMAEATDFTKNVKQIKKAIEEDKEEIYRPAKSVVDQISARYKPMLDEISRIEKIAKDKMLTYQREQQRIAEAAAAEERRIAEEKALAEAQLLEDQRKAEEAAIKKAADEQAAKLKAEGRDEDAQKVQAQAQEAIEVNEEAHDQAFADMTNQASKEQKVESTFNTGNAASTIRKVWDFELVNINNVPSEFLMLDTSKVRQAVRNGERDLSGIRIYQKEQLSIK